MPCSLSLKRRVLRIFHSRWVRLLRVLVISRRKQIPKLLLSLVLVGSYKDGELQSIILNNWRNFASWFYLVQLLVPRTSLYQSVDPLVLLSNWSPLYLNRLSILRFQTLEGGHNLISDYRGSNHRVPNLHLAQRVSVVCSRFGVFALEEVLRQDASCLYQWILHRSWFLIYLHQRYLRNLNLRVLLLYLW